MNRVDSKVFKRFTLSFLIVLVLPVTFFIFLFLGDFKEIYRSKLTKEAKQTLEVIGGELDRQIENFHGIVIYNSQMSYFQSYAVERDVFSKDIQQALKSELAVHSILEDVCYYNSVKPDRIYTTSGTYTLPYYAKLSLKLDGGKKEVLDKWGSVEKEGWIIWKTSSDVSEDDMVLQYVIKVSEKEIWFFTIDKKELENILGKQDTLTILTDKGGNPLFSTSQWSEVPKNCYEITALSENGYFRLIRTSSESQLFLEISEWQHRFFLTVAVVMLVGFVLVMALTFYNEYPIRQIQIYWVEKMHVLEKSQIRDRLLLRFIWDEKGDKNLLRAALKDAGLFLHAECFRVMVVVFQNEESSRLGALLDGAAGKGYEFQVMEVSAGNMAVVIVGMTLKAEEELEKILQRVVESLKENGQGDVCFYVGGLYRELNEVCQSYRQAMICSQSSKKEALTGVVYYQETEEEDVQDNHSMTGMISQISEQIQLLIDEEKKEKHIISEVIEYIDDNVDSPDLSVSSVADYFDISISNLSHQFKTQMGCTISAYITEKKFAYASELLLTTDKSVSMIAEMLGYSQARSFIRKFGQYYGVSPMEYRNQNKQRKESGDEKILSGN